jgi:hypothetical protein
MIEEGIEQGKDRGRQLYDKFPSVVTSFCLGRKKQYHDSAAYSGLKNRCRSMDKYIDNESPVSSTFMSDITPQTIRKAYIEFSALFRKFLETDPLFSVSRISKMPVEMEHLLNAEINDGLNKTYFRDRCLFWSTDDMVRYGTSAIYTFATSDYNASGLITVKAEDGYEGTYKQVHQEGDNVVVSTPIHPLNVIIDPRANFMVSPDFIGFIGDICVANIANLLENDVYIQSNLKEVFELCKKGLPDEHWFCGDKDNKRDYTRGHSNITYMWTRLGFEGNEDDSTWYAVEIIGDKIIRIEENNLDENCIPLALQRIMPRKYVWFGNTPLEDKICIQNLLYWSINTTIESTARAMDRIVLYRGGGLDIEAINSRHQTAGFVPYTGNEQDLSRLMYSPQMPNNAFRENDWLTNFMRREDQDSSAMPNFNPQSEGGPTNKTLGGAQMMASIGEIKMALMVDQFCAGLKDVAKHRLALQKNISTGNKDHMLGQIQFDCKVSNVFNYAREALDSQNRLNNMINLKATKLPQMGAIKIGQFIEDVVRNSVKRENIDDYCDTAILKQLDDKEKAAAMNPPPPQPPAPPVPNISVAFQYLPPDGQMQVLKMLGIQNPQPPEAPMGAPAGMPGAPGVTPSPGGPVPMIPTKSEPGAVL